MIRRSALLVLSLAVLGFALAAPASAEPVECTLEPRSKCFGVESLEASLSTEQAGAHPDLTVSFTINQNPNGAVNPSGLFDTYGPTRNVKIELPPGLIGDPNILGRPQQCTAAELITEQTCPNGSQIGRTRIYTALPAIFTEPVYMMVPPENGDVIARVGFLAGGPALPAFIDVKLRSEDDYGIISEIVDAPAVARLIRAETTLWGVPAAEEHDIERCTPGEAFEGAVFCEARPPGSTELPFLTNPTRCGVPLEMRVSASGWAEPNRYDTKSASFPQTSGCDSLVFGPDLTVQPTSHRAASPTGLDMTIRLPAAEGVDVFEPSQMRDIRITFPAGLVFNPGAADGVTTCSEDQVRYKERVAAECPDAAKVAETEFEIPALPRRMKGAVYLREPEPGNLFRVWIVADDLGAHVKLPGQLEVDQATGQITSVLLDAPQAPLREVKLLLKSGLRAPLATPAACGTLFTDYEFTPWSGGFPYTGTSPMEIDEGCDGLNGFDPKLSAGTTNPAAGKHSPFLFTLTREDGEQSPSRLDITLPKGLAATLAGVPRCDGAAAQTGACPAASQIGRVLASAGYGPLPLWVPQPGKRPTAVYLAGPYKGAPLSVVAVVPAQAGPYDLGDQVVRSAIYIDPVTAQATVKSDPLPQIIEGIPVAYRTVRVILDRPNFSLNPTGCGPKSIETSIYSTQGAVAHPSDPFGVANCSDLGFKPRLALRLFGGTKRGGHPAFRAVLQPRPGDSNIKSTVVRLPHSAFLDQGHIRTVCTRVQYAAGAGNGSQCPAGSAYGQITAFSPLLDEPLSGPVILRSSNHLLPDLVFSLHGLIDVEASGRIDSVNGGVRATFESIPDAPITKAIIKMQGGKKGLIENSRDLCAHPANARVELEAHNGRDLTLKPRMQVSCKKK